MKKVAIIILTCFVSFLVSQNPPDIVWTQNYEVGFESAAKTLLKTPDGGYVILTGGSDSSFLDQATLIKLDSNGSEEWRQAYGGAYETNVSDVILMNDENYLILRNSDTDNNGDLEAILTKVDADGNVYWEQFYGIADDIKMTDLQQTNDGGFILCGTQNDLSFLLKLDENGNEIWNHPYFFYDAFSIAKSIIQTTDQNYLVVGYKENEYGFYYSYIMKVDADGYYQWSNDYSSSSILQNLEDVVAVEDGCFIAVGAKDNSSNDTLDGWIKKFNDNGDVLWDVTIGGENVERFRKIKYTDNGYYLLGDIEYYNPGLSRDIWTVKVDYEGAIEWEMIYDECNYDIGNDLMISNDGFAFLFTADWNGIGNVIWLVMCEPVTGIEYSILSHEITKMTNHPNPFNPSTSVDFSIHYNSNVELVIFNIKGQKIKTLVQNEFAKGSHSIIWDGDDENNKPVSSGIYFYKLYLNGKTEAVKKCLLLK